MPPASLFEGGGSKSRRECPFPRNTLPQSASLTAPSKKGPWAHAQYLLPMIALYHKIVQKSSHQIPIYKVFHFPLSSSFLRTPLASLLEGGGSKSRRECPFPRNTLPQSASLTAPSKKGPWAQQTSFTAGIHHLRSKHHLPQVYIICAANILPPPKEPPTIF